MSDESDLEHAAQRRRAARRLDLLWLLPLAGCSPALSPGSSPTDPLRSFDNGAPPVESLTFERTILDDNGHSPAGAGRRLGADDDRPGAGRRRLLAVHAGPAGADRARRDGLDQRAVPWVLGEAHKVTLRHQRPARRSSTRSRSPCRRRRPRPATSGSQALVGAFVGILPVAIGLMFYPALRGAGPAAMNFLLALTVGLLGVPAGRHDRGGAGARGRIGGPLPGAGHGGARRRGELPISDGRRRDGGARPTGLRSRPTSRSASGCTISARAWRSARPSRPARQGSARSSSSALRCTTSPRASASPRRSSRSRPPLWTFAGAGAACRRPGGDRHVARQPRLCAAMVGAGAGRRRRRDPAGHRRGRLVYEALGRARHLGAAVATGARGLGGWRRLHVRDRDAGEDLRRRRRDQVALIRRAQSASQF